MWTIHLWIISVLLIKNGRAGSYCMWYVLYYRYSGTVSVTNNGHTCQAWSAQTPHEHSFNDNASFPDDGSVIAAKNYCRNVWDSGRPWCFTTHPDIRWGYCDFAICTDVYRQCGEVFQSSTGSVTAPDFDGDGLYDTNVDCLWTVQAPENYVIRYEIQFYEIEETSLHCVSDALMIFEKGRTERLLYCGTSSTVRGRVKLEGETLYNILYVQFYSNYRVTDKGFNITFRHLKAQSKDCGGIVTKPSGWITSPDLDQDGFYDFNLNCSWIIEVAEYKLIAFQLLYLEIVPSEDCLVDRFLLYDVKHYFVWYCDFLLENETEEVKTISNVLFLEFVSDNINTRAGFKLEYKQASKWCLDLDNLRGYNGTVSTPNHGQTCQAWSSQIPHPHSNNQDSLFPMDGSVIEASNYCRDIHTPGRPWCYTMDQNILWSYCTFPICKSSTGICGGLIKNKTGVVSSRAPYIPYEPIEADCLWTIQADESQVIRYYLRLDEMLDQDQCQAHALVCFEKGEPLYARSFCDSLFLNIDGETRSNVLLIRYYKDRKIRPVYFIFIFEHVEAQRNNWTETLRSHSGWIIAPDRDEDNLYDFNLNYKWIIEGNASTDVVLLKPVYFIIENSPDCSADFVSISDDYGTLFVLCGIRNDTEYDAVESRLNHLYILFKTNGIISARGFIFSFEIIAGGDDCLTNFLQQNYTGKVSVTNHGITCQHWISQTPHPHAFVTKDNPMKLLEDFNYCRSFESLNPWCFTMDPYIRWQYCTFSICNGTYQKCDEVLQNRTGIIVPPDYDRNGLYDPNVDCMWIVEAPGDHVIQFHIYFVDIESSTYCSKDLLQVFEKKYDASGMFNCGSYKKTQSGETQSNVLYVTFFSDNSIQGRGFNMSYAQLKASSLPDKRCSEILRKQSGWITAPDNDGDGFYDFNLNCVWTVEVKPGNLIRFHLVYVDLDIFYSLEDFCKTDRIVIYDELGIIREVCGVTDNRYPKQTLESRSNIVYIRFESNNINSARGFNLTYMEFERETNCFDELKSISYSGTVSVTNNGLMCQAWSAEAPHNHSENKDNLFPIDGSVSKAKNYCRDVWRDGRPWCYTINKDIKTGFCTLKICNEIIQQCGGEIHNPTGTIGPPDSNNDMYYDMNVDCLWIIVAAENEVVRHKMDYYVLEDSIGCRKDALWIYESDVNWFIFCGTRADQLVGETLSNKLFVHFFSDESWAFRGFQLTFVLKQVSSLPCGGPLSSAFGWLSAPDTDGDGLYEFNMNCTWTLEVTAPSLIQFFVTYVVLDPCDEGSDSLTIYGDQRFGDYQTFCGNVQEQRGRTAGGKLYIQFVSNSLDVGLGFALVYKKITEGIYKYQLSGDGWIRSLDLDEDGLYDNSLYCEWLILTDRNSAIELEIHFMQTEGIYPVCGGDFLTIRFCMNCGHSETFCGTIGRQAKMRSYRNAAAVYFSSDFMIGDIGFLLAYQQVNDSKKESSHVLHCPGWITSFDSDESDLYAYHARLIWTIESVDENKYILAKLLYIDVEESRGCSSDSLSMLYPGFLGTFCGTGFKKVFTILSQSAVIIFQSDYTINRIGFNMSFLEFKGVTNSGCDAVLTGQSGYLASVDTDEDGQYDHGQDCRWTIRLGYTNVIVFEVLKQDIYQSTELSVCENDFLEIKEDHRHIGKYCGKDITPSFATEANVLYVQFIAGQLRSGKGFEAVYFQTEDVSDCLPGYKCLLTEQTIQEEYLCDSYRDCIHGDDERFCHFRCPRACLCTGFSVDCTGRYDCGIDRKLASVQNQTFILSSTTRMLDISSNNDMFLNLKLERQDLSFLTHLNLSSCEIVDLPVDTFLSMKSLKVLDLSFNKMRHLKAKMFLNQENLEIFLFKNNSQPLIIESEAFVGLVSLQSLVLSSLQIERISKGSFSTLHLKNLTICHSHIAEIESASLDKLHVESIYFNSSVIDTFTETMFHGGDGIYMFVTDKYKYCCVRPLSVQEENCYPQKDEFSSCDDLIKHKILRPLIWVVGLFALLSNVISLIYRLRFHAEQLKFCYGVAVVNLSGSDSLLGIYLIIIGITDNIFRGTYIFHDESWRESAWCQLAGVLSTVSCEASLLFSCLITVDRFLVIKYPFGQKRLTQKNGIVLAIVFWGIALFLAILPVTLPAYFKGNFYSQSGLCLALPLTRARSSVWGYAFGIFVVLNSIACLLVAIGQWKIYREIKSSEKAVGDSRSKSTKNSRITRNLLLVVTTNFLCWLPVEFIGVLALADFPIPVNVYSWIAVIALPVNSAVNPVLYTLSDLLQKKQVLTSAENPQKLKYNFTAGDLENCTGLWKITAFWTYKGQAPGYATLTAVLKQEWFCSKERLSVAVGICNLLHRLHDWKLILEGLTADDIFVKKTSQHRCKVAVLCRPQQILKEPDRSENMLSLGLVLSTLIKKT